MTNVYTVTFDIADGSFEFYSKEAWKVQIAEWRDDLETNGCEGVADMDYYEVVELIWGDEMFIDFVTPAKIK